MYYVLACSNICLCATLCLLWQTLLQMRRRRQKPKQGPLLVSVKNTFFLWACEHQHSWICCHRPAGSLPHCWCEYQDVHTGICASTWASLVACVFESTYISLVPSRFPQNGCSHLEDIVETASIQNDTPNHMISLPRVSIVRSSITWYKISVAFLAYHNSSHL